MRNKKAITQIFAVVIIVLILAVAFGGYAVGTIERSTTTLYGTPAFTFVTNTTTITQISTQSPVTTTVYFPSTDVTYSTYTNTMYNTSVNINLFNYCPQVSAGGFEFRLVSNSTGLPVIPDSISAVNSLTCNSETQVARVNEFYFLGGGWIIPVIPSQAMYGGGFNITATYEGKTYNFLGGIPPIGTNCLTLNIPSGNTSSTTVMNGSGSYC